ncbi:MAG: NAD-binding protein [bacterium]|nr:NAD-binding protein [bacterium]
MERRTIKIFVTLVLLVIILISGGWIGFMLLDVPSFKALTATINILSGGGLGSPPIDTNPAWGLISLLQIGSLGIVTITLALLSQLIIQGAMKHYMGRKRMDDRINHLNSHSIIVGYSLTGASLARDLKAEGETFVVVENNPDKITKLGEMGILYVEGNALDEETLKKAGIERARAVFAVLSTDSDNLMLVLSARGFNEKIKVVSKVTREDFVARFYRAGADSAISPQEWASRRMVQAVLRPNLLSLLSSLLDPSIEHAYLEEVKVVPGSPIIGKTIGESGIRPSTEIVILGVATPDGVCNSAVGPGTVLNEGDVLIGYGQRKNFKKLVNLVNGQ